tara:strand:- start:655 stop:840 length:186 start_codon:yes stop_codon:yes gene_type:complete
LLIATFFFSSLNNGTGSKVYIFEAPLSAINKDMVPTFAPRSTTDSSSLILEIALTVALIPI